jgi:predicted Zn-dependent protease with MMP-like domain
MLMHMKHDWERYVEDGLSALDATYREKIRNVAILLEDEPNADMRKREGLEPDETLLGLYQGIPLSQRGDGYGIGETVPDTITLYMNPLYEEAEATDGDVARVVRETLWHEFGHYFGLDEPEVERRERKRFGNQ